MTSIRPGLRLLIALAMILCAIAACTLLLVAPGRPDRWATASAGFASLVFLGLLGFASTPTAPTRPARIVLGFAVLLCAFLLLGIPFPPATQVERASAVLLTVGMVLSLASAAVSDRRPTVARSTATGLAVYGAIMLANAVRFTALLPAGAESPGVTFSRAFAILLGASWIAALWHLRPRVTGEQRRADIVAT
jgi:hypothetical protein